MHSNLMKNIKIHPKNEKIVIELLRQIAEVMIWGDQHEPKFFE